jgi:aspartate aminotransferase-like enzyme
MSEAKKWADQGMTPTTPPLSMVYAFRAALGMITDEGLDRVWERHRRLGAITREGITGSGLQLFAEHGFESNSLTAFLPPPDVTAGQFLELLRRDYGVEAQGGQAHLADRLIRIGHMGWVNEPEMRQAIDAVADASALLSSGHSEPGKLEALPVRTATA